MKLTADSTRKSLTEEEKIWKAYPEELKRIFNFPLCELEGDFLGFLESYRIKLPKDFTIIDLGCYQGVQSVYFTKQKQYIGVDIFVPTEWRMNVSKNTTYYQCSIQDFIRDIYPELGLDPNKTFAICSYVPDKEARKMVKETFSFYRDIYCDELEEQLPENIDLEPEESEENEME